MWAAIIGVLGGAFIKVLWQWRKGKQEKGKEQIGLATLYSANVERTLDRYLKEIDALRQQVQEVEKQNESMQEQIQKLRDENAELRWKLRQLTVQVTDTPPVK